jgi:pilus retraction protein PilT
MPSPDDFVRRAFETGASDLILAEGQAPSVRIHGEIVPLEPTPLDRAVLAELWAACGADPEHVRETDVSWTATDGSRLRVNLFKSLGKLSAVLRPIKRSVPDFQELGLPAELLAGWLGHRSGLILVSGPAGSGKSTTVASCLDWINRHYRRHIVTIEDPIEYLFENDLSHFSQREIGQDTETFSGALRVALRQSPDIIFLGEIRDEDSALIALRAAETGHLVLATLHSSGVPETLDRLGNLYPPNQRDVALQLLGDHLIGVLSQRLLPAEGGGLFLAVEHLENEAATRQWIRDRNQTALRDFLNRSATPGSVPFLQSLREAVLDGIVHPSTARAAAPNAHDFDRALRGIS